MGEFVNFAELGGSAPASEMLGQVAVPRTDVFEPGVIGEVDIERVTLGHSGDGGDGNQKYHIPGRSSDLSEVQFS